MKNLLIYIGTSCLLASCAIEPTLFKVDDTKTAVTFKGGRGTIFDSNYSFPSPVVNGFDSMTRWTPNKDDVKLGEEVLRSQIKVFIKKNNIDMKAYPIIYRHINNYFRQYVGLKKADGPKLLRINMSWDKLSLNERLLAVDRRIDYKSDYSIEWNYCNYYWEIDVNLDDRKLSNFRIRR